MAGKNCQSTVINIIAMLKKKKLKEIPKPA